MPGTTRSQKRAKSASAKANDASKKQPDDDKKKKV